MQVYLQSDETDIQVKALDVTFNDDLDYADLYLDVADAPEDVFAGEEDDFYRRVRGVRSVLRCCCTSFLQGVIENVVTVAYVSATVSRRIIWSL